MRARTRIGIVATAVVASLAGASTALPATGAVEDRLLPAVASPAGTYGGIEYIQYDGIFEGATSTGAFRVPYRITAPADRDAGNGTVVVEPPHFARALGALNDYLRRDVLLGRGFAHAGVGWSTAALGAGRDKRILDPTVPGTFVSGGKGDHGGRTDPEIVAEFSRALEGSDAEDMLGDVERRYATGFSDSSFPLMDLIGSGRAAGAFDLMFPFTTQGKDPQPALENGRFDGRVAIVNSELDKSQNLVDRGVTPGRYRHYVVGGTGHVSDHVEIPSFSSGSSPASFEHALRAHFLQSDLWVRTGSAPPVSYHLKDTKAGIKKDAAGNALTVDAAGNPVPRLPFVELGEAQYISGFLGGYKYVRSLSDLGFADHAAYVEAFGAKLDDYRDAGYILPEEADRMLARAELCPSLTYTQTYRDHYDNFVSLTPCAG